MHWSVSAGVSKSLSSGKPPRRGWPSVDSLLSFWFFFFFFAFLSFFITLTSSILLPPSTVLSLFCPAFFWSPLDSLHLSSDSQFRSRNHFSYLSTPSPAPFLSFFVFTLCPLALNDPQCCEIWFPFSQNCKASWDQRSKVKKAQWRKREKDTVFALQTHETTVASPPKRQAQQSGPEKLAGPLSTSLRAILNANRRGLTVETKPWCHAAYFPWKVPGVLGPTPGDMRSL